MSSSDPQSGGTPEPGRPDAQQPGDAGRAPYAGAGQPEYAAAPQGQMQTPVYGPPGAHTAQPQAVYAPPGMYAAPGGRAAPPSKALAITALSIAIPAAVLRFLPIVGGLFIPFVIASLIIAIVAIVKHSPGRAMSIWALVISIVGFVLPFILFFISAGSFLAYMFTLFSQMN
ncbi:hypothetical protein [Microbacterium halotolerans]|uniref:hypothetical protein n=1 Tax=Microbacterium halotolerans TaxID=246613 RepID=UPI0013C2D1D4|nr:hypothetical protein [Microbacterium halotolerans]